MIIFVKNPALGKVKTRLAAEIGDAIESHLKMIGMIVDPGLDEHQQALVDQKRKEFEEQQAQVPGSEMAEEESEFPEGAVLCAKCSTKAAVLMDGCMTCLNCGDSKCG